MASLFKPLVMAESSISSLSSLPTTLLPTKPSSSYAFSKPLNFHHSFSSSLQSSRVSLKTKKFSSLTPLLVAQTPDWAQQEEGGEVAVAEVDSEEVFSFGGGEEEISGAEGGEEEESFREPPEEAKLFVGNLSYDVDSESLANLFNDAGVVEVAEVIYNRETDQSRGFGFVTMSTVEEADKAVDMFNRYELNGRNLTVNKAAPRGSRPERPQRSSAPSLRIYVGNLPWQVDDSRLEQLFSEHGKVVDARVVFDRETQRSRGFGFVTMSSETEINDAIAALDGQTLDGRAIRVNVAEDRPRRNF